MKSLNILKEFLKRLVFTGNFERAVRPTYSDVGFTVEKD